MRSPFTSGATDAIFLILKDQKPNGGWTSHGRFSVSRISDECTTMFAIRTGPTELTKEVRGRNLQSSLTA